VDYRDMATGALLVFSKICSSLPLFVFLYFFFKLVASLQFYRHLCFS
jgi:hypothetical protein